MEQGLLAAAWMRMQNRPGALCARVLFVIAPGLAQLDVVHTNYICYQFTFGMSSQWFPLLPHSSACRIAWLP